MPDPVGAGSRELIPSQSPDTPLDHAPERLPQAGQRTAFSEAPASLPDLSGQPTSLPPDQSALLHDAVIGKDPSQLIAAEYLRSTGGTSATEILLGLNLRPTILGAFPAPPGNQDALRRLSPARRRAIIRSLLLKQGTRMRRLAALLRQDSRDPRHQGDADKDDYFAVALLQAGMASQRANDELMAAAELLDLLQELLEMQDYTLSRMGAFSKG